MKVSEYTEFRQVFDNTCAELDKVGRAIYPEGIKEGFDKDLKYLESQGNSLSGVLYEPVLVQKAKEHILQLCLSVFNVYMKLRLMLIDDKNIPVGYVVNDGRTITDSLDITSDPANIKWGYCRVAGSETFETTIDLPIAWIVSPEDSIKDIIDDVVYRKNKKAEKTIGDLLNKRRYINNEISFHENEMKDRQAQYIEFLKSFK